MRQYVGARYIPKMAGKWSSAKSYEALTIVSYNNDSYISKIPVPVGIQITNDKYWMFSGSYNGQINDLQQKVNDINSQLIVSPERYGAYGDGIHDDTLAIQKMFDKVRSGIIAFPSNARYLVSKTITIYGGYATLTVLLGDIYFNGVSSNDDAVIELVRDTTASPSHGTGELKIYGGLVDANNQAKVGVKNVNVFHVVLDGTKIKSYQSIGLYLGDDNGGPISAQMMCSNIYIDNFRQPYREQSTAIKVKHTDNNFVNCVTNDNLISVDMVYGGNYFSNCHFTSNSDPWNDAKQIYTFVNITPENIGAVQENLFTGCYFNGNNVKTIVSATENCSINVQLASCSIVLGANENPCTVMLQSAATCTLQIDNVGVRRSVNTLMMGLTNMRGTEAILTRNRIGWKNYGQWSSQIGDFDNFCRGARIMISHNNPLESHTYKLVGVLFEYSSNASAASWEVVFNQRQIAEIYLAGSYQQLVMKAGSYSSMLIQFFTLNSEVITIGDLQYRIKKLYVYNPTANAITNRSFIQIKDWMEPIAYSGVITNGEVLSELPGATAITPLA